jgi:formylmethanofuran dehydrogenase subunit E
MRRLDLQSEGMEEVMAEVECNNCFVDGIQVVSGCTLGNNALIYRDLGKTAVTFYRRGESTGLRLCVRQMGPGLALEGDEAEEADRLFEKAVTERKELDEDESRRFRELWRTAAQGILEMPDEDVFSIDRVDVDPPSYAPIFDSAECTVCGEEVMETRARLQGGEPVCLSCSGEHHWLVHGAGIIPSVTGE